jgi:DNA-binding NarL/FixJ family response regulator
VETLPIRILAVDQNPLLRGGISILIDQQPDMELAGLAESFGEALRLFRQLRPDVTLLDLDLPSGMAFKAIEEILRIDPAASIIGMVTYDWDPSRARGLRAGAHACIAKDRLTDDLVALIRSCGR